MGLLSDPSLTPRNKFGRNLAKHSAKISTILYLAGLMWFVCLAHPEFNHGTYLSENALSPGLVYPEMKQDSSQLVNSLLDELRREHSTHKTTTPHAWIAAKMRQIGLETHEHHFTLRFPFAGDDDNGGGGIKEYHGKNIYGILRAPRIGSTEGLVFAAPYRAASSVHTDITTSVPLLLAFADFARKKNYWAKDLIFLVTEQEQLGMQAWLGAYYEGGQIAANDSNRYPLDCGSLPARAGALQAALNLEVQDLDIDYLDVKIEGLNGQLPNLDMFNLVQRITSREGLSSGYKQTPRKKRRSGTNANLQDNLWHMIEMLLSQSTGVPTGNHGLFHRYRIESLTLEAVKRTTNTNTNNRASNTAALPLLKTVEGIARSLNNLLERFHQSYFFYLLVQNDRFVSIGDFMPCLVLLAAPMFITAFLRWLSLTNRPVLEQPDSDLMDNDSVKGAAAAAAVDSSLPFSRVLLYMGFVEMVGILCTLLPLHAQVRELMSNMGGINSAIGLMIIIGFIAILLPYIIRLPSNGLALLQIGTLLFIGVSLIVLGLLNFALGFLVAVFIVPLAILLPNMTVEGEILASQPSLIRRNLARFYAILLHPLSALYLLILLQTFRQFPHATPKDLVVKAANAMQNAISLTLMDCIIYGNWLYRVVTAVFLPIWTLCWTLAVAVAPRRESKLKTN